MKYIIGSTKVSKPGNNFFNKCKGDTKIISGTKATIPIRISPDLLNTRHVNGKTTFDTSHNFHSTAVPMFLYCILSTESVVY